MLDAAETVLEKLGPEGATLARVAKEARLSPANVYRRFRDKDALMAAVFDRFTEMNAKELAAPVDVEQLRPIGIRKFAKDWVAGMIAGFRHRTGLTRAAMLYTQQHQGAAFVKRKMEVEIQGFRKLVGIFLIWRDEIRHPDPEYAVGYAIAMVALALRELIILDHQPMFNQVIAMDDDRLREELPRVFLRYLGIDS